MKAERIILETDDGGKPVSLPPLPPRARIEAILLMPDEPAVKSVRTPPAELAAMTEIYGDITQPAIDEEEWEALR